MQFLKTLCGFSVLFFTSVVIFANRSFAVPHQLLRSEITLSNAPDGYFPKKLDKAMLLLAQGHAKKALTHLEKLGPSAKLTDKYFLLSGLCYQHLNKHLDALAAFNSALSLRGSNSDTLYYRALSQIRLNRFKDAYDSLEEALWFHEESLVPREEVQLQIAHLYLITDDVEEAGKRLDKVLAQKNDSLPALTLLSEIRLRQGRKAEALSVIRKALTFAGADIPNLNLSLADALLLSADRRANKKDIAEAEEAVRSVLAGNSLSSSSRARAAKLLIRATIAGGKLDEAEKVLTAALKENSSDADLAVLKAQLAIEKKAAGEKTP